MLYMTDDEDEDEDDDDDDQPPEPAKPRVRAKKRRRGAAGTQARMAVVVSHPSVTLHHHPTRRAAHGTPFVDVHATPHVLTATRVWNRNPGTPQPHVLACCCCCSDVPLHGGPTRELAIVGSAGAFQPVDWRTSLAAFLSHPGGPKLTALHLYVNGGNAWHAEGRALRLLQALAAGDITTREHGQGQCQEPGFEQAPGIQGRVESRTNSWPSGPRQQRRRRSTQRAEEPCLLSSCCSDPMARQTTWKHDSVARSHDANVLSAAPSSMAYIRDLTLALDNSATSSLLFPSPLHARGHLQRLLVACTSLRRLHLHFKHGPFGDYGLERYLKQCDAMLSTPCELRRKP